MTEKYEGGPTTIKKWSDLGLHCMPFYLYFLDALLHGKTLAGNQSVGIQTSRTYSQVGLTKHHKERNTQTVQGLGKTRLYDSKDHYNNYFRCPNF